MRVIRPFAIAPWETRLQITLSKQGEENEDTGKNWENLGNWIAKTIEAFRTLSMTLASIVKVYNEETSTDDDSQESTRRLKVQSQRLFGYPNGQTLG